MVEMLTIVDSLNPTVLAREILMVVAKVAAEIFTILFPMRIDIRRASGLAFIFLRALDQLFFCLVRESTLWLAMLANAVSLAEKNIEIPKRIRNTMIERGSILVDEKKKNKSDNSADNSVQQRNVKGNIEQKREADFLNFPML
jgi:hypothetical protein